jgi:PEP-CTERM motif
VDASIFFAALGGDNIGPILDNVSLTAVPLPAAAWLLLSGLAGLGFVGRRKAT